MVADMSCPVALLIIMTSVFDTFAISQRETSSAGVELLHLVSQATSEEMRCKVRALISIQ